MEEINQSHSAILLLPGRRVLKLASNVDLTDESQSTLVDPLNLRGRTGEANISDGSEVLEAEDLFKEVIGKSVQRVIRHEHRFECGLGRVRVESGERVGNAEIT
ncbi:hypothetical protein JHK85_023368 [Glycine max]|nr:hypothetical protein JHK85_023368 [Glycine max]